MNIDGPSDDPLTRQEAMRRLRTKFNGKATWTNPALAGTPSIPEIRCVNRRIARIPGKPGEALFRHRTQYRATAGSTSRDQASIPPRSDCVCSKP